MIQTHRTGVVECWWVRSECKVEVRVGEERRGITRGALVAVEGCGRGMAVAFVGMMVSLCVLKYSEKRIAVRLTW